MKILLIDGDRTRSMSLAAGLRAQKWDVFAATDAIQALTLALKERPDCLVVSCQLPGGNGPSVVKRLRSIVHTSVTPIIALTARDTADCNAMLAAGAQECCMLPVDAAQLCDAIRRHLGQLPASLSAPREVLENPQRLKAVEQSGLLDRSPDTVLDELTALASKLLKVPTATITIIDRDRQVFKSQTGLPSVLARDGQTPLSHSFCQWVVSAHDEVVVDDARTHAALRHNEATRDYNVIAYAGVPLSTIGNQPVGAFCAIDSKARHWSDSDLEILRSLRRVAELYVAREQRAAAAA